MRLYRVKYFADHGSSAGFEFFPSKEQANKATRDYLLDKADATKKTFVEQIDGIQPTRTGIIALLNKYAAHADNG